MKLIIDVLENGFLISRIVDTKTEQQMLTFMATLEGNTEVLTQHAAGDKAAAVAVLDGLIT